MKGIQYNQKCKLAYTPIDSIDRRSNLSYEEFVKEYASVGKPVIITDVIKNWKVSTEWTMDFFRSKYGSTKYPVVNYKPGIGYWNQKYKLIKIADYIDYITSENADKSLYLSEFNARNHPELLEDCDKVIYFNSDSKNWYRKIPLKYLNRYFGRVSKILIGRKDSTAGLHYDRHCDTAWVAVMSGRKQIVLFSPDQEKYLYGGRVDPFNPDLEKFPLYANAKPVECILNQGEFIHIPPIWWHDVKNIENTIGLTNNTLNEWNYELVRRWMLNKFPVRGHFFPLMLKDSWLCRTLLAIGLL